MSKQPMPGLAEELVQVAGSLNESKVAWALVGGYAVSLLTEPRATQDLDMLVEAGDWEAIKKALRPLGYQELASPMDFKTIRLRRLTKLAGEDVFVVDFLFADEETRAGLEKPLPYSFQGTQLAIAPPATIINLKRRRNSAVDAGDIEKLLKLTQEISE